MPPSLCRRTVLFLVMSAVTCAGVMVRGCGRGSTGRPPGPMRVVASIAPLSGLVRGLAPEGAEVTTLIPPGRSLHGHEMTPSDVAALARADVLVYVGLGLEPRVETFLREHPSGTRRVVCFADVAGIEGEEGHEHKPGEAHDHEHAVDPHLWLDPSLVEKLIPAVARALEAVDSAAGVGTREGEALARVRDVDVEYRARLAPFAGVSLVTHHNAFGRIADRYGLRIAAVIRPTESAEPTPGQIEDAVRAIRELGARAVICEPQYDPASAEAVARAAGVPIARLDAEGQEDWFGLMRGNLEALTAALGPPK